MQDLENGIIQKNIGQIPHSYKKLNVLLISLQENLCTFGIRYIFHAVRKASHQTVLLYPNLNYELSKDVSFDLFLSLLSKFITDNQFQVVGLSFMSYQVPQVKRISGLIRKSSSRILLVGGGIHATAFPQESLEYLDAVCLGEGELSFINFLEAYSRDAVLDKIHVRGIVTRYSLNEEYVQKPPFFSDLDNLQILPNVDTPTFIYSNRKISLLEKNRTGKYNRYNGNSYDITTSRGCPLSCSYCANNIYTNLYDGEWLRTRMRSVNHVISELREATRKKPSLRFVNFHDDSFLTRPLGWLQEFVKQYSQEIKLPIMFRIIPGSQDPLKLSLITKLDIIAVGIGLQSGSLRVLRDVYNRPIKIVTFMEAIQQLNLFRITSVIDVILNNPYEAKEDILQTIDVLTQLPKPFLLELYGLRFYPGTEITKKAIAEGIIGKSDTQETQANITEAGNKVFLNKVIFITPHYPRKFIHFLVRNEDKYSIHLFFPFFFIVASFLNFISFLRMILRSQRYNLFGVIKFLSFTFDLRTSIFHVFPFWRNFVVRIRYFLKK